MTLEQLDAYFRSLLDIEGLAAVDSSANGLQVERAKKEITKVAFAVDACEETFRRAAEAGADLLFVHHGLFWGREQTMTGGFYRRIKTLLDNDLALYACHLPLDLHPELGNNAAMTAALGLREVEPFGLYKGVKIGFKGKTPRPYRREEVLEHLGIPRGECLAFLPFGPEEINTIALVSGGAPFEAEQAAAEGMDLYLTGDASHTVYHSCRESKLNLISAGHYATETWGVAAMMKKTAGDTGLETQFIDVPTGL